MKNIKKKDIKNAKLFIFDWSGTLSDDRIPVQTAFNRVAIDLGLKPTENLNEFLKKTVKTIQVEFSKQLLRTVSPEEIWNFYVHHLKNTREDGIKPIMYEDTLIVLDNLKNRGKKLIVLSSHPQENLILEAEEYGLTKHFDKIIGSISNKTEGIIQTCKDMLIDLKDASYIGDMINDVKSAKKAKVISVALTRGYHDKKTLLREKPDYLLEKLADLINFL